MYRLVPALVARWGRPIPNSCRAEPVITETLMLERPASRKTLERGLSILDEETRNLGEGHEALGETAFTL
jgi:alanyl-tRNA synthetase